MPLRQLILNLPLEQHLHTHTRPYVNHSIEPKQEYTAEERSKMLESVGLNVFFFPSEMITGCDLLSDSGTSTMTSNQWAIMHFGDEAYGSNRGYFALRERICEVFGEEFFADPTVSPSNAFLFHQGRAAENALFSLLGKNASGQQIPSNGHFDTTQANIEANAIEAVNLYAPELKDPASSFRFKGNMDAVRLEAMFNEAHAQIPLVYLTITNNTGGGQPVSMENIRAVASICHRHDVPLFFDACRFAENAWFIKSFESGYANRTVPDIVREMFSHVDGFTISFKKDGLVNMGGGLFLRRGGRFIEKYPCMLDALTNWQILKEGHPTYGGMSGRDIMALTVGLEKIVKNEYLTYRTRQVEEFGNGMATAGLPVLTPIGGHAVYLDVNRFFEGTALGPADYGGIALTALLLAAYGHRACELGYFAFGHVDPNTGENVFPEVNFVRFAVPRLRYESTDLQSVTEALTILHEHKDHIPGVRVSYGRELTLRHFKARFQFQEAPAHGGG